MKVSFQTDDKFLVEAMLTHYPAPLFDYQVQRVEPGTYRFSDIEYEPYIATLGLLQDRHNPLFSSVSRIKTVSYDLH